MFLRKSKPEHMKGKVLSIYAKDMFKPISRRQVIFTDEHITKIVEKFRMFERGEPEEEIAKNDYVLTPGRYVGMKLEEDETPFEEKMKFYSEELSKLLEEEKELTEKVKEVFKAFKFEVGL